MYSPDSEHRFLGIQLPRRDVLKAGLVLLAPPSAVAAVEQISPSKRRTILSYEEAAAVGDVLRPYNFLTIAHDAGNSNESTHKAAETGMIDLAEMDLQEFDGKVMNDHAHRVGIPKTSIVFARVDVKPLRGAIGPPRRTADEALQGILINGMRGAFVEWKEEDNGRGEFNSTHFRKIEGRGKQWGLEIRHHTRTLDYFKELADMVETSSKNAFMPANENAWTQFMDYASVAPRDRRPAVIMRAHRLLEHEEDLITYGIPAYVEIGRDPTEAERVVGSGIKIEAVFSETETFRRMGLNEKKIQR